MTIEKVQKYKRGLGSFIRSEKGQRFFNFAYSIGAAVVIWGALFKILHLPGGNMLLSLGMGTEVLMFLLTAFDRPPREYHWEDVFPALRGTPEGSQEAPEEVAEALQNNPQLKSAGITVAPAAAAAGPAAPTGVAEASQQYVDSLTAIAADMERLHAATDSLTKVADTLLGSFRTITDHSGDIAGSAEGYVGQMQSLTRNIAGLNAIYELQLRSISSQVESIERVNRGIKDIRDMYEKSASQAVRYCEETERMAHYMQQLNSIYERMVQAMTVNMYHTQSAPGAQSSQNL